MLARVSIDSPAWRAFVESHPDATPFHHPTWGRLIASSYGLDVFVLALGGERDGPVRGGLPVIEVKRLLSRRRWSSLPYTDVCAPLVAQEDEAELVAALEHARRDAGVETFEICASGGGLPPAAATARVQHVLELSPDPAVVEAGYRPAVRRNIRSARDSELVVRRSATEADLVDVFFRLQVMTRQRLGLPPQPRRFFRALWAEAIATGLGELLLVELHGIPVAGAVLLRYNGVVVYKYGASDPDYWHLRPNNLLFADAITQACLAGDRLFHFGRSDPEDEGLRRFKAGWGAVEQPLRYSVMGRERVANGPPAFARALIRRAPLRVAQTIGEVLYRYAA